MKRINFLFLSVLIFKNVLCSYEAIIFDIFGVLFTIPPIEKIKYMSSAPIKALIFDKANIFTFPKKYLNILSKIEFNSELTSFYNDHYTDSLVNNTKMPPIIYLWQANKISYQEALKKAQENINQNTEITKYENKMLEKAIKLTFDIDIRKKYWKPIPEGVEILKECASQQENGQKKYKLYILSNMDHEMMKTLKRDYPEIFGLFDGIVYSAESESLKPEPHIFEELLSRYDLNPTKCIFIDDQEENINQGNKLGIKSILCNNFFHVTTELFKLNILDKKNIYQTLKSTKKNFYLNGVTLGTIFSLIK